MNGPGTPPSPASRPPSAGGRAGFLLFLARYGGAVAAVAVAAAVRWLLRDVLGTEAAFATFYPAVALTAVAAGGGPGVLATGLSAAAASAWLIPSNGPGGVVAVGLFVAAGLVVSGLAEVARRQRRDHLARTEQDVAARTTVMEEANAKLLAVSDDRHRDQLRLVTAVVENVRDAVIVTEAEPIDEPGPRIVYVNPAFLRNTGYTREEVIGRSPRFLQGMGADRAALDAIRNALGRCEPCRVEVLNHKKDGTPFWVELDITPLADATGRCTHWIAFQRDITDRKRAEDALREREYRLSAILTTAADAIITIDRVGVIESLNRAAEQMFGYAPDELVGRNVSVLMTQFHRDRHDEYLARYVSTGQPRIIGIDRELSARRKDGSTFPIELAVSEIDHLRMFAGIIRDGTRRKELEREVVEAATDEQRRIGQDLHDTVGQELTALNIQIDDLADALRTDPTAAPELAGRMGQSLRRCQRELRAVIRGLLPVAVDAGGLMAALTDLADRTGLEGGVRCEFDCPKSVAVADNVTATQLYLIAHEAVHNAVKHAQGRVVRVTLAPLAGGLVLRVADDGRGMPADPRPDRGQGLRIMHHRARIIGGRLTIGPAVPTGTVVSCELTGGGHG